MQNLNYAGSSCISALPSYRLKKSSQTTLTIINHNYPGDFCECRIKILGKGNNFGRERIDVSPKRIGGTLFLCFDLSPPISHSPYNNCIYLNTLMALSILRWSNSFRPIDTAPPFNGICILFAFYLDAPILRIFN